MSERVVEAVFFALARQLSMPVEAVQARANEGLDVLGLDPHSVLLVMQDIEQTLGLTGLTVPDDAYSTPASLIFGVIAAVG